MWGRGVIGRISHVDMSPTQCQWLSMSANTSLKICGPSVRWTLQSLSCKWQQVILQLERWSGMLWTLKHHSLFLKLWLWETDVSEYAMRFSSVVHVNIKIWCKHERHLPYSWQLSTFMTGLMWGHARKAEWIRKISTIRNWLVRVGDGMDSSGEKWCWVDEFGS